MKEHDSVVLTQSFPDHGLQAGDVGAIVHVYGEGQAFEVEFVSGNGGTVAVVTLEPGDVRPLAESEILHVRRIPA
jgi:cell envelope opacity-associated protein A